jgi:hypothetical protein
LELPSKGKKATKDRPNMVVKPHMRAESEPVQTASRDTRMDPATVGLPRYPGSRPPRKVYFN